jgi:GT2 family glycosyltransferase
VSKARTLVVKNKPAKTEMAALGGGAPNILSFLNRLNDTAVEGWAVDMADPLVPLRLRVLIDESLVDVMTCDRTWAGTLPGNVPRAEVGFSYQIPLRYQDGGRHVLRFTAIDGAPVTMATRTGTEMPEVHFCLAQQTRFEGILDGVVDGLVQGWALSIDDRTKTKTGGLRILVTESGQPVAELLADQYRGDVASALNSDAACGFTYPPSSDQRRGRRAVLRFYIMPGRYELQGSPLEIVFPDDGERDRINALIGRTDELFAFAYHLRRELRAALPGARFTVDDYARWAAESLPLAPARAAARYGALPAAAPLVSVISPVYRPAIEDFLGAVDSVRAQSYPNWELLLVDDASGDPALRDVMARLAKADPRIKPVYLAKNAGIAAASNVAIRAADGELVAFFDHDDVLEPAALEIMVRAQAATGARLLYSDEDKIDRSGRLSEPHFKPDFNYRFLLDINYICHFVMVKRALFDEVGMLDSAFDGAQDHDFLLRVCEHVKPAQIHHVAEVLYHWRKTAASTAAGAGAKPLAPGAGVQAVAAHLKRRKLPAVVAARDGLTCYRVTWRPPAAVRKAARVSILIPFREHVDLTAKCVAAIRAHTKDVDYEILLLDNWSVSPEAERFCAKQGNMPNTRIVRIAEPFNYSRINNIGAKAAAGHYLLFLNNDVFVSEPHWLRVMLDELLVNERLGAVGEKLIYPNATVQHAGVVLGVGGIADHAFRGVAAAAHGYMMHATATQWISAVTGACMLVRRAAFEAVGGFDEVDLPVAFNDVDLCLKLSAAGWEICMVPDAVAEHHESISRGDDFAEPKVARFMLENEVMRQRYKDVLPADPFYNPHFSRDGGVYRELRVLRPTGPFQQTEGQII